MKRQIKIWLAIFIAALVVATVLGIREWSAPPGSIRNEMLALMPSDASVVVFADFAELRQASFIAQLYAWAPKPQADADYAQFVKDAGFDYEKDLAHIAIAVFKNTVHSTFLAVANGHFDQKRISAYAQQRGRHYLTENNRTVFLVPTDNGSQLQLMFVRENLLVVTNDDLDHEKLHDFLHSDPGGKEWQTRFERLAGSPLFAVVKQNAALGNAIVSHAPGGLRSPQLSTLIDRLQWITIAGKPDSERLRVVAEGECLGENTVRQLADVLNGVLILAEGGLNDAKTRQQLDPAMRNAYLELLKSADVSKIDRGDSKSVRLVFDLTPGFLEAASRAPLAGPETTPNKPSPRKAASTAKGRT